MRGDVEPLGDLLVAEAFADEFDHLGFATRHAHVLEQALAAPPIGLLRDLGEERFRQPRRQHLGARGHRSNRHDELLEAGILEHEAGHPCVHELRDILVHRDEIHHDDLRARSLLHD